MEEIRYINGQKFYTNKTLVRIYDDAQHFVAMGTLDDVIDQGLWCKSVHVWLFNTKGQLFIQQRSLQVMNNPGKWGEAGGGYIDGDMTSEQTLETEMKEELGLKITPDMYWHIGTIKQQEKRADGRETKQYVDVYLVESNITLEDITLDTRDVMGGMFIPWQEFAEKYTAGQIDFVDHKDEIQLVLKTLTEKYH